ncbi:hypothetical protein GOV12_04815 [Candidatus Pacearchaeota archaeon]|nr:hypothetical protein [Candidatus Pacearchaeota archaeon]
MKAIKPSKHERKRYLLIVGRDCNKKNIEDIILEFIGVLGYSEASPQFIKVSSGNIVLSINREVLDKIRTCFMMSAKDIEIKKVSGSVSKVK